MSPHKLTTGRTCGGCTACCTALGVQQGSFHKPPGQRCPHSVIGRGCMIYPVRPDVCQSFACAWLEGWGEDRHRPDKSGVVIQATALGGTERALVQLWEARKGALDKTYGLALTRYWLSAGVPVALAYLGGRRQLVLPRGYTPSKKLIEASAKEGFEIIPTALP